MRSGRRRRVYGHGERRVTWSGIAVCEWMQVSEGIDVCEETREEERDFFMLREEESH